MNNEINLVENITSSNSAIDNNSYTKLDEMKASTTGTPKIPAVNNIHEICTPKSKLVMSRSGAFNMLPVINTPPRRFPKVFNPFDSALTDRLHLPIICR